MKKLISAAILSLSILTHVQAESYMDYVSLGLAMQTLQDSDSEDFNPLLNDEKGMAIVVNAGKHLYEDISLEVEGTASVVQTEWSLNGRTDVDFWSLGFYGAYIWRINNLSIKPRIGFVYENMKATLGIDKIKDKADMGLSGGVGVSYQFNHNYSVYSNFTKFEDDMNHLTFGAEYKF